MYLLPDGRLDIKSLSERHVPYRDEAASAEAALWAARRYDAIGPDGNPLDRTVLLLLSCAAADSLELPYGVAREILGILRDAAAALPAHAAGGKCPHPDGHAPGSERSADRAAHVAHLYAPGICPAPGNGGFGSEPRTCPVHPAEAVARGIAEIEE